MFALRAGLFEHLLKYYDQVILLGGSGVLILLGGRGVLSLLGGSGVAG